MTDIARLSAALADRYAIERELGQGGMATVYLAADLKHARKVALKVLRPELAAVLGAERFVQEIKTTAALQHPHILPLFDSGTADSFLYYVMPYIEGETLRTKLDREKQFGVDEAVKITSEVADALDYAHRHGVIHRDIKPENILLHDGRPMVADFGIALAVSAAAGGRMTETGLSLGTPHYMSPEQATAEKDLTSRSDIYSLACVLYEMLAGHPPHVGATAQQIIMKIVTEEAAPVTSVRKSVPPHVAAALARALETLPADRFESAKAFATALGDASATPVVTATRATRASPVGRARRRLVPWAIASVASLAAVASWLGRPGGSDTELLRVELDPPLGTEFAEFRFAALSPDGGRLVFVGLNATGGQKLFLRDLATGRVDSLPGTRGATAPFWSPDGHAIGYVTNGALFQLDLGGQVPRQLCPAADMFASWSAQGVILFTSRGHPMTVPAGGGSCTPVGGAWSDSTRGTGQVAWLPDGRHFVGAAPAGIMRSTVDGDTPESFIPGASDVQFVAPDLAVYARNGSQGADVVAQRFDRRSFALRGAPVTLAHNVRAAAAVASFTVSARALAFLAAPRTDLGPLVVDATGRILDSIAVQGSWTMREAWSGSAVALAGLGLWTWDYARHAATVASRAFLWFPVWSPGDSLIAAYHDECRTVMVRLAGGRDTALIDQSALPACYTPTDWTADGWLVLVRETPLAGRDGELWALNVRSGVLERLVSVPGTASAGAVSPDRQWLAYVSNETGELEVFVRPFRRNGAAVRISTGGGALPRWRRDGRVLYFITPDGRIVATTVSAGAALSLGTPQTLFRAPRWSMRLFADQAGGRQLTTPYDVNPDGTKFLVRQGSEESSAATLLVNWQRLLSGPSDAGPP